MPLFLLFYNIAKGSTFLIILHGIERNRNHSHQVTHAHLVALNGTFARIE